MPKLKSSFNLQQVSFLNRQLRIAIEVVRLKVDYSPGLSYRLAESRRKTGVIRLQVKGTFRSQQLSIGEQIPL